MQILMRLFVIQEMFKSLIDSGFDIIITADHGNIEIEGIGKIQEGKLADVKVKRCRAYPDEVLRKRYRKQCPEAIDWSGNGLPDNYFALLAPGNKGFCEVGSRVLSHGGISLEEVIVPFSVISRKA